MQDPQTLLSRVALPPGAEPAPRLAKGLLAGYGGLGVGAHLVWRVPMRYRAVLHFFKRQHPRGARHQFGMVVGRVHLFGSNRELDWSFRPIRPFLSSRTLRVTVLALTRHATGVRVESADVWRVRPPNERVPAGTRTITIRRGRSEGFAPISRRITEPGRVAQVVRRFDALKLFKPSTLLYHCARIRYIPPTLVTFLSAGGQVLAEATIFGTGTGSQCGGGGIAVTVRGRPEPELAGRFLVPVLELAGVRIPIRT